MPSLAPNIFGIHIGGVLSGRGVACAVASCETGQVIKHVTKIWKLTLTACLLACLLDRWINSSGRPLVDGSCSLLVLPSYQYQRRYVHNRSRQRFDTGPKIDLGDNHLPSRGIMLVSEWPNLCLGARRQTLNSCS